MASKRLLAWCILAVTSLFQGSFLLDPYIWYIWGPTHWLIWDGPNII